MSAAETTDHHDRKGIMSIEIKTFGGRVLYTAETAADVRAALVEAVKRGAYLRGADLSGAYLSDADLRGADLRGAYLRGADLSGAYLSGADLRDADLSGADLSGADLSGAYLRGADLSGAYLSDADLSGAYLRGAYLRGAYLRGAEDPSSPLFAIRVDLWDVLDHVPAEVSGLRAALVAGKVDGSVYEGPCSCLVGTIAQVGHLDFDALEALGLPRAAERPAEQWFYPIREGHVPDEKALAPSKVDLSATRPSTDELVAAEGVYRATMAVAWIDQWTESRQRLFAAMRTAEAKS